MRENREKIRLFEHQGKSDIGAEHPDQAGTRKRIYPVDRHGLNPALLA